MPAPAGPLGAPRAAWAVPHAECLRREAQGSQQRAHKAERQAPAAKYHVLMLCMPHQLPCSNSSLFPCPATSAGGLLPGLVGPTPHQDPETSSGLDEDLLSHCVVGREVPGCTGRLYDLPCFEGWEESCRSSWKGGSSRPAEQKCPVAPVVPHCHT